MPTALQLIKRSMRLVGALGGGETPTADEQTDGLTALNSMLDAWSVQGLNVYQIAQASYTWSSGQVSQTIGSGGDFAGSRPTHIEGAFQRESDIDYPINIATEAQYSAIPDKATQSTIISWIYPDYGFPLVTLRAYPVPSANVTVYLRTWTALQSFSAATTDLAMPPGYEDAVVFNLALQLAPEYQRTPPPHVFRRAATTLRAIKSTNVRAPSSRMEVAYMGSQGSSFDYRTG